MRSAALLLALALVTLVACSSGPYAGDPCSGAELVYDPGTGKISLPELACPSGQALACCGGVWTTTDVCRRCGEIGDDQLYCTVATDRFTICGKTFSSTITQTSSTSGG